MRGWRPVARAAGRAVARTPLPRRHPAELRAQHELDRIDLGPRQPRVDDVEAGRLVVQRVDRRADVRLG
jgi:hypothetical protein